MRCAICGDCDAGSGVVDWLTRAGSLIPSFGWGWGCPDGPGVCVWGGDGMSTMVMTEVFTLAELVQRGDERAVDRALMWMSEAWDDVACESVSETLSEALRDAFGANTLTCAGWDYYRNAMNVSGSIDRSDMRNPEYGALAGLSWPGGDRITSFTYRDDRDVSVWSDWAMPDGWNMREYDELCAEVIDFVREIEFRLTALMQVDYEFMTSRQYLLEIAEMNNYTFTAEGKRFG